MGAENTISIPSVKVPKAPKITPAPKMKFTIESLNKSKNKLQSGKNTNFEYLKPLEKQSAIILHNFLRLKSEK